jgi:hypothetical protein
MGSNSRLLGVGGANARDGCGALCVLPAVEICDNWAGEGVQGIQLLRHSSQRGKR